MARFLICLVFIWALSRWSKKRGWDNPNPRSRKMSPNQYAVKNSLMNLFK